MNNVKTNLIFDPEKNLAFDLYEPEEPNGKILIFWHGGGWFRGDKLSANDVANKIADAGFLTFVPNYRLAPRYTFPSAHVDTINFVKWLLKSTYYQVGQPIVQIGASVGGTMAINLSMEYGFKTVTWSAPLNFSGWMEKHHNVMSSNDAKHDFDEEDPKNIRNSFYKYFVSTYIGEPLDNAKLVQMDAISNFQGKIGNLLMVNSINEIVPLVDTLNFIKAIAKSDKPMTLQTLAGSGHAMDYADKILDLSLSFLE